MAQLLLSKGFFTTAVIFLRRKGGDRIFRDSGFGRGLAATIIRTAMGAAAATAQPSPLEEQTGCQTGKSEQKKDQNHKVLHHLFLSAKNAWKVGLAYSTVPSRS